MAELLDVLPEVREDFLCLAIAAFDQACIDGAEPREWQLTKALFDNLAPGTGWWSTAQAVYVGNAAAETLGGLPVRVVPGAHHQWDLVCKGGAKYGG